MGADEISKSAGCTARAIDSVAPVLNLRRRAWRAGGDGRGRACVFDVQLVNQRVLLAHLLFKKPDNLRMADSVSRRVT
jgi:hypothetical protein